MSAFKEALLSGLEEYLQRLQVAIEGLTAAEVRWQPTMHTNHIAWLVWHPGVDRRGMGRPIPHGPRKHWVRTRERGRSGDAGDPA